MITYTVTVTPVGRAFSKSMKIKNVVSDGIITLDSGYLRQRYFIIEDGTRVEVPMENVIITFSKDRRAAIEQQSTQ